MVYTMILGIKIKSIHFLSENDDNDLLQSLCCRYHINSSTPTPSVAETQI